MPTKESISSKYSHLLDPDYDDGLSDSDRAEAAAIREPSISHVEQRGAYQMPYPPTEAQIGKAATYGFNLLEQAKYYPYQSAQSADVEGSQRS